jgi:hypothetical protein
MMAVVVGCLLGWVSASSSATATETSFAMQSRRLDQADAYANYHITEGPCFRVKVPSESDDDGNAYFYNGAYHAQYTRYMAFQLCTGTSSSSSKSSSCSEYVTTLDQYLEVAAPYLYELCTNCANQNCKANKNKRFLEEGGGGEDQQQEEEGWTVDCSTCPSTCSSILQNYGQDETQYLECQQSYQDGDIVYYAAPQCDSGTVVIGSFYDDQCTYKAELRSSNLALDYTLFQTLPSVSIDCSTGYCNELLNDAIDCLNADDNNDNSKICKAADKAGEVQLYARKRKQQMHMGLVLFTIVLISGFAFLSYTYYIRHRNKSQRVPMAALDGAVPANKADASLPTLA